MVARRAPATPAATGTRRWPAGAWPDAAIVAWPRAARLAGTTTDARALPSGAAPPMHAAGRFTELLAHEAVAAGSRGFAPVRHAAPKTSADAVTQLRWARERCAAGIMFVGTAGARALATDHRPDYTSSSASARQRPERQVAAEAGAAGTTRPAGESSARCARELWRTLAARWRPGRGRSPRREGVVATLRGLLASDINCALSRLAPKK